MPTLLTVANLERVNIIPMYFSFFIKQKTAYEMRISDWSSDVCSSDLARIAGDGEGNPPPQRRHASGRHQPERAQGARAERLRDHPQDLRERRRGRQIGRASGRERVCQYV